MRSGILSLILIIFSFNSCQQNVAFQKISPRANNSSFQAKVDSIIISKMNEYEIPGLSIGVVQGSSVIYTQGYGLKSINSNEAVTENSIFHTASLSKLFTASAVMKLVKEESLSLEDKMVDLIPELKFSDERVRAITLKNLLNSTSGLPDIRNYHWANNNQSDNSLKEYIEDLDIKLESAPSEKYSYSNLGYNILGFIIEKTTNLPFEDYLQQDILTPAGMLHSDFRYFKIPDSLRIRPHSKNRLSAKIYEREVYPYSREHAASSTLNASTKDLSVWMIHFFKTLNSENKPIDYNSMILPSFPNYERIGLGFQLYDFREKKAVGHFGGDRGFRSFLMMIPEEKIGLVVLANCDYKDDFRQEIIYGIAGLMLKK